VSAVISRRPPLTASTPTSVGSVARALARVEARRMLRSPVFWIGVALTLLFGWTSMRVPGEWSGARYTTAPVLVGPVAAAISLAVAGSFQRERAGVSEDAPVGEGIRAAGRLLGALSLVAVVAVLTAAGAIAARWYGGFDLGDEPGRTLHAHFSWPEVLQPVALALLAVAVGAAAGRRFRNRASATLTLFVGWFPFVMAYWMFQAPAVTPFSVIQVQPISVEIGPVDADPLAFPATWLLSMPGEFQDHWARLVVSVPLGAGHNLWLLGLTALFLALALPRRARPALVVTGTVLVAVGITMQYLAIP
jgi:hypothetical protein